MRAVVAAAAIAFGCGQNAAPPAKPAPKHNTPEASERERTPELDRVFGELLPRWVVALNNPDPTATRNPLIDVAREALPATCFSQLEAVLASARAAREAPEASLNDASDRLDDAVAELDRRLSAAGLAYQIDGSVISSGGDRSVLLFSFAVDRVRRYRSGDTSYDALWASRLDKLAFRYRLVGLAAERRDAMVLPARVDEWLLVEILPVIAEPDRWREGRARASTELPATIGAALSRELGAVAGDKLGELAKALADRARLVGAVSTLTLTDASRAELSAQLSADDRERLETIERNLGELDAQIAFGKVRELAIAAIEHHEIQHQIDAAVGLSGLEGLEPAELIARRELSAYLAEVARNERGTHLAVTKLAGFALSPTAAELEREVASSIIANLAAELGGAADSKGAEALSVATALILLRDRDDVARAAARLWTAHFGGPLAELQLAGAGSHTAP